MGKGVLCVALFSVIITILFCVMCYLMSSVNPPPLKSEDSLEEHQDTNELKFENVIFDDVPSEGELPQYGVEKIDVDNVELNTLEPNEQDEQEQTSNERKSKNFTIWRYTPKRVVPPLWASTTTVKNSPTKTTNKVTSNQTLGLAKSDETPSEALPIKGHRRSINSLKKDNDKPAFVILKILDSSGESRIEIKISSNKSNKGTKIRDTKSSKNKSKFSMSLQRNNNDEIKKRYLAKNTIISILPNDTIVVDEYERILSKQKNKTKADMQIEENFINGVSPEVPFHDVTNSTKHNITDYEDVLFTKSTNNISIGTTEKIVHKNLIYTQSENVLNNDISNTVLDDFTVIQTSTRESIGTTNKINGEEIASELTTGINLMDLTDNTSDQKESSRSAPDLTNSNVQSFDLLSKLDAISENSTFTVIESISHDDSTSVSITERTVKIENFTILTTNLTFQNDNTLVLATNQNEDLVRTSLDSTVLNEDASVENKSGHNLVY